ncbi:hypothetical protein SCUP515_00387 [Seiridium cupressi]
MSSDSKPKMSARDLELAGLVWQCFETDPKVDYKKLAEIAGFKNPATASACWLPVKKKLMAAASGATKATPKSAKRKKDEAAHEDEEEETSTKKVRAKASTKPKTKATAKAQVHSAANDELDEDKVAETGEDIDARIEAEEGFNYGEA